ncbi:hypothetical protein K435DRAFT_848686 [Dendrothele bispora CBS 962.96]|uniref:Hydrophobin n=1 Tax=Dendrothele bispora (strain CBS 962.96) TaxID=1314807 RepID=A0A4V4HIL7_DENBC|nr:hypothetical protein K435DRAFT_848686 [Dendrothele bispora CBS 962.96]
MFNRLSALVVATIVLAMAVPQAKAQCATGSVAECCAITVGANTTLGRAVLNDLGLNPSTVPGSVGIVCQSGSACSGRLCCTTTGTITSPIGDVAVAAGCSPSPA